ncbi:LOW QUALITY PROTEIN: Werner syndrome ATP-dependent helicase [Bufo gargarizans]|uniref:LOW QUALITY PROTEIN: Werner syndrome ATP-dependent helicase n=1 Tax=Bufo gargarizans TaxID=30331 RepID=UPI001CF30730|nr:LOW QUALITY PROTEIN: Werner syndrome ATP-dependent helicase [Bufo gargarizans]
MKMSGEQRKLPNWMSEQDTHGTSKAKKNCSLKKNILEDNLPFLKFSGSIVYSYEAQECSFFSEYIRERLSKEAVLGFDIEWPPAYRKGKNGKVSLIQVCTSEEECYLFQVSSMTGFPKGLKRLLEDMSIKKVGVGIEGDQWKLMSDCDLKLKGFIELTDLANQKLQCKEKWSLNGLVKHLFNKQLLKDDSVRCSDWNRFPLSEEQKLYAASDAYAGLLIYQKLESLDEKEKLVLSIPTGLSSGSCEVKNKLNSLSQELLVLVDQVPGNFEDSREAERAVHILDKLSSGLEDLRNILVSSKEQENGTEGEHLSQDETNSASMEDCHAQRKSSKRTEGMVTVPKDTLHQPLHSKQGLTIDELNMIVQEEHEDPIMFDEKFMDIGTDGFYQLGECPALSNTIKSVLPVSDWTGTPPQPVTPIWLTATPQTSVALRYYFLSSMLMQDGDTGRDNAFLVPRGVPATVLGTLPPFSPKKTSGSGLDLLAPASYQPLGHLLLPSIQSTVLRTSYIFDDDEEFETEMLKSVEILDKSPESFSTSFPQTLVPSSKVDHNAVDEEEDEGIEEEEEDDWDPALPEPNVHQISCLKTYFGHSSFKPVQWKVINSILKERRDNLVVMATGYGKSLCYQFAPVYTSCIGIVISPLISLMEDQVLQLTMSNIPACFLGSAQSKNVMHDVKGGKFKVIYMTPEFCSVGISLLQELDNNFGISLIAVDEAHCISEWGHDFRSAYRSLGNLKRLLPSVPVIALTATASPSVRNDILASLHLHDPQITCTSFDRPNLYLEVARKTSNMARDLQQFLIKKHGPGWEFEGAAIVYCPSRKTSEQVTAELSKLGISCDTYHAGIAIRARRDVHHRFMRDEIQCVVATVAFGMGINKPDIRKVIHYGAPKEMESYYQEIGRAGRDGLPSSCHVLWAPTDMKFNRHMLSEIKNEGFRDYKLKMLAKMEKYLNSSSCRRKIILSHFEDKQLRKVSVGIMGTEKCCDNCKTRLSHNISIIDQEDSLQDFGPQAFQFLSAVEALGEKFGTGVPVLFLRGSTSQRLPDRYRCHLLFGKGKDVSEAFWKALARQLISEGFLQELSGRTKFATTCGLASKGRNWMSKAKTQSCPSLMLTPNEELCPRRFVLPSVHPRSPMVRQPLPDVGLKRPEAGVQKASLKDKFSYQEPGKLSKSPELPSTSMLRHISPRKPSKPPEPAVSPREMQLQTTLYGKLVAARQKIASEKDIPPAVLATNKVLVDMAKIRPTTVENMKKLDGVSEAKANMLAPLVEVVKEFCLTNSLKADSLNISGTNLQTNVAVSKGSACIALPESPRVTYSLFQEQCLSMQTIADTRSISLTAVGMHLWQALKAGYPLDLQRAGLTPAIQKTITEVIKGPTINSDLSSFQAIRSLLDPEIDIYLIRMVITLLEKEDKVDLKKKTLGLPKEQPQSLLLQARDKPQEQEHTQLTTTMDKSHLWIEKEEPAKEITSSVQKDCTSVVAPIKLASWNQQVLDEDTEELFSDSQVQTPKRKLPEWFEAPKETARSSNIKKAKTVKKKGLFG